MFGRRSIANRLSRYVLLISAGLLLTVTVLVGLFSRRLIEKGAAQMAEKDLQLAISDVEQVIAEVETAVGNIDWFVQHNSGDSLFMYEATRELVTANVNIIGSAVAFEPGYFPGLHWFAPYSYIDDDSGEMKTIQMGNASYDYHNLDWYHYPKLHDEASWSEPYFDAGGGGQRMATYSFPLKDTLGRFFGVLTSDISLEWLSDHIRNIQPYAGSYATLVSAKGIFIAHPDSSKVLSQSIFDVAASREDTTMLAVARNMVDGNSGSARFGIPGASEFFAVYGPLSNGWSILLVNSYALVFRYIYLFNVVMGFLLVVGLIAMYFGCRKVIRKQIAPMVEFSFSAMNIAKGNFKASIPEVTTKDEMLTLRNSLDYMQQSINDYIAQLKTTTASKERYESELNIARNIQMSMLPQNFPRRRELALHAMVQPAKEVGGDLYDFIELDHAVYFLVGDVSGKGVPAALFMAIARAAFRFIGAMGLPLEEIMTRVNNCLCDGNENEMFVTIFAGRIDLESGMMDYCNAGHNPIVVVSPGGEASLLRAKPNLAAGLFEDFPYEGERLQLAPGTRLVLYTDGVTEAEREDKSQFGEERLLQWAGQLNPSASADAATLDLYAQVRHFAQGADQNDDITIMSILLNQKQ